MPRSWPPAPSGRMGACETSPSTSRQPGHITIFHTDPTQPPASSPPDDAPPLVGVQLVRPRLRRKRLRLRALQLDPSNATAQTGSYQETGSRTVTPDRHHATGQGHHALLTRPTPMGATMSSLRHPPAPPADHGRRHLMPRTSHASRDHGGMRRPGGERAAAAVTGSIKVARRGSVLAGLGPTRRVSASMETKEIFGGRAEPSSPTSGSSPAPVTRREREPSSGCHPT
jgi:hypothetical protein